MEKPWSVVDDEELRLLRNLAEECASLDRGCDCEYDYRCGRCEVIIHVKQVAQFAREARR